MKTEDGLFIVYCNRIFSDVCLWLHNVYYKIRNNWDTYKCNPAYMPFSQQIKGRSEENTLVV